MDPPRRRPARPARRSGRPRPAPDHRPCPGASARGRPPRWRPGHRRAAQGPVLARRPRAPRTPRWRPAPESPPPPRPRGHGHRRPAERQTSLQGDAGPPGSLRGPPPGSARARGGPAALLLDLVAPPARGVSARPPRPPQAPDRQRPPRGHVRRRDRHRAGTPQGAGQVHAARRLLGRDSPPRG